MGEDEKIRLMKKSTSFAPLNAVTLCEAGLLFLLLLLSPLKAQPPSLQDPFLDNFVGDWQVNRDMGKRGTKQTSVHCEWVLNHQFIEFHYGANDAKPEYEAFVFIGFDAAAKSYVCHWVDVFGARDSAIGYGKFDPKMLAVEFKFGKDGDLTNKFTFDPQSKTWTSLIRQIEKGQWMTFAEEKWTRK
jgi:hypothetical protein